MSWGDIYPPSDALALEDVTATIKAQPYRVDLLVSVDLNANLTDPEGTPQGEVIADEMLEAGL